MSEQLIPRVLTTALREMGENLTTWRKLRHITAHQLADRAGVSINTVLRLESGKSSNVESLFRVARALGILDDVSAAFDPFLTDVGRLRADKALPRRVRN